VQHGDRVVTAAFDPTGKRIVTASWDNTARIWRAPPTGQALVEKILAVLGPHAPEPLKLPENPNQNESYGALMALGCADAVRARAKSVSIPLTASTVLTR
jgi:WD40 repeat protein